jgi:hypothetical protein
LTIWASPRWIWGSISNALGWKTSGIVLKTSDLGSISIALGLKTSGIVLKTSDFGIPATSVSLGEGLRS